MPLVKLPSFILQNTELSVTISFGARTVIIKIVKAVNKFIPEITCPYNHFYYRSVILSIIYHIFHIWRKQPSSSSEMTGFSARNLAFSFTFHKCVTINRVCDHGFIVFCRVIHSIRRRRQLLSNLQILRTY